MISRVGLIGDVHGEARTLKAVLAYLRPLALDALLCTGDLPIKGYTHRRLCRTVAGVTILNPGALIGDKEPPRFFSHPPAPSLNS